MPEATSTTGLLVSVRNVEEARRALQGGAALIDIKEPTRGALGRADDDVIAAIVAAVAGRRPVSAALGEWSDGAATLPPSDLNYVKWGLAEHQRRADWRIAMSSLLQSQRRPQVVLTAYADWQCAGAPSVEQVLSLACEHPGSVMLIDTCCKAANGISNRRPTLLDWMSTSAIEELCAHCRDTGVRIALAGSLDLAAIQQLLPARPDWFAVRGAVCTQGDRQATVQTDRVRDLANVLAAASNKIHVS
jgi:(5-formylfuran-3-yl)methyl phosphate synthase